ncbi:MAG TPA: hypothetical protein VHT23_02350 [Gemmatimonadaceae bacterium]|jgi:hypothetical protein|nr:hypothetical protein [Gemmatimonadaceae bacterium]
MGAAAAIAIMRMKEREVVDDFRAAGALTPSTAQSYTAMGFGESRAVKRLHREAVIREASPGLYYLDEEVWNAVRSNRRRRALMVGSLLVLIFLGLAVGFLKW